MRIAVLGAGNGGQAIAGFLGLSGYDVSLYDIDNSKIQKFKKDWFIYFNVNLSELASRLNEGAALSDDDKQVLTNALNSFKSTF